MTARDIDAIIPTRDRSSRLAATLTALAQQDCDGFGVIVVDDGGQVAAQDELRDTAPDALSTRFVRNETSIGPGPSRNRGVAMSDAPYVVFIDDDCIAGPELITRHRTALARSAGSVVSLGPILSLPGQQLTAWNHWDASRLEREYTRLRGREVIPAWTHMYTGNVGVRREDFVAAGGFDARFTRQEDIELGYRLAELGCRFEFDSGAVVFHDSDRSLSAWTAISAASAQFDVLMDRLDPGSDRLSSVIAGLGDKHWALRLVRRIGGTPVSRRSAVFGAIGAGRVLHAIGAHRAALPAFSLAWDLTYTEALGEAISTRDQVGTPR